MMPEIDLVVIGDGPAGTALANACTSVGVGTLLVGERRPWTNTYGTWLDDLASCHILDRLGSGIDPLLVTRCEHVAMHTSRRHTVERSYGLLDNDALRNVLEVGVDHHHAAVTDVEIDGESMITTASDGRTVASRIVVDATGWPARFAGDVLPGPEPAWQTAFGVVLRKRPDGDLGQPTVMDFRRVDDDSLVTFAYSLPVADGWLVEETVLAARPSIAPERLKGRLARRLGMDLSSLEAASLRTESVRIPMGGPCPSRVQPIVAFGAAAGGVHPISGYSVVASLDASTSVAAAIHHALTVHSAPADLASAVWDAVWPMPARRSRVLHDYGLEMLLRLDGDEARSFFSTFFELPTKEWAAFMRSGTPPGSLARTMAHMFRDAPMSVRRQLVAGNPLAFSRLLRPR